jgi:hypothetical protein
MGVAVGRHADIAAPSSLPPGQTKGELVCLCGLVNVFGVVGSGLSGQDRSAQSAISRQTAQFSMTPDGAVSDNYQTSPEVPSTPRL